MKNNDVEFEAILIAKLESEKLIMLLDKPGAVKRWVLSQVEKAHLTKIPEAFAETIV